ncbi:DUF4384 domain-containing protein [Laspinema sp. A4]|uniref:DUF4384 domain-containing protein n=1 Tax=Laspinema sp. D2d TaxID=2953686 RepID=UPI0021BB75BD|nr:DUF4384 domain-containing protein [Laspinema sp. D2d]MCT7982249.1 DUF4384 domain-containing protein [Laspinema sp. D2d]
MIAITPANSLQERFLNDFVDQVIKPNGSDRQRLCCRLRFYPLNKRKKNARLATTIEDELNIIFPSTNMPGTLGEVITKIKDRFGDKMAADGIALDLLQGTIGGKEQPPDSKAPWEIIYQWLWEIEFPRRGWELAKEMATSAMAELQMIDPKKVDRDLVVNVAKATIRKGEEYALLVDFPHQGHLLLINQGVSGKRYCLCPSLAFSVETQVTPDKKLHIPGIKALASSLQYQEMGNEYFLAILTEHPVKLSWVNPDSEPADILVTDERLREIFQEVGRQWNARVFSKKFEVVE